MLSVGGVGVTLKLDADDFVQNANSKSRMSSTLMKFHRQTLSVTAACLPLHLAERLDCQAAAVMHQLRAKVEGLALFADDGYLFVTTVDTH